MLTDLGSSVKGDGGGGRRASETVTTTVIKKQKKKTMKSNEIWSFLGQQPISHMIWIRHRFSIYGSRGERSVPVPSPVKISFYFHAVFMKGWSNNRLASPLEVGIPSQVQAGGRWTVGGYPLPRSRQGGGDSPIRRQSSIACTCYVAGGVPLAFTQEDFLVCHLIS